MNERLIMRRDEEAKNIGGNMSIFCNRLLGKDLMNEGMGEWLNKQMNE